MQGLGRNMTLNKIEEMFDVFGDIENIIINSNQTCYLKLDFVFVNNIYHSITSVSVLFVC